MPSVSLYTQDGKANGEMSLPEAQFGVKVKPSVVHEALLAQQANRRKAIAHTKTKGEVRGGGKKPWKQKGTGRARQGSTRNPQWVGGGVAFGPRSDRNFSVKINRKTKQKALFMALSDKVNTKNLLVIESIKTEPVKTKAVATLVSKLPLGKSTLIVAPASNATLMRMVRNMPNVTLVTAQSVNLEDVMKHRSVAFLKDAVAAFEKIYLPAGRHGA
jgi:large subunit ribosomal protein L4